MTHDGANHVNIIDSIIADAISPGLDGKEGLDAKDRETIACLFLEVGLSIITISAFCLIRLLFLYCSLYRHFIEYDACKGGYFLVLLRICVKQPTRAVKWLGDTLRHALRSN